MFLRGRSGAEAGLRVRAAGRAGSLRAHQAYGLPVFLKAIRRQRGPKGTESARNGRTAVRERLTLGADVAARRASGAGKSRDGRVEAIRALRVARCGAVKARAAATNQLKPLLISGPAELRQQLRHLSTTVLITTCANLHPTSELADPVQATKASLRALARRHQNLSKEITEADVDLKNLVTAAASSLLALRGVGIEVAGRLLTTAGDNPDRLRSEAAFAHLCGVAPVPASSGRTHRHRLNCSGDRAANNALYIVVLNAYVTTLAPVNTWTDGLKKD